MNIVVLVLLLASTSDALQTTESCPVPNIVGLTRAAAASRLQESDLALGQVQTRTASQPAGSVIDQQPRACAPRPADGRVNVLVSTGEATSGTGERGSGTSVGDIAVPVGIAVGAAIIGSILSRRGDNETVVPDLVKLPVASVEETLRKARLRGGDVTRETSMTVANGVVISQAPVAGTKVVPESTVSVRVSTGRPMTEVPDLAGLDWQGANARITAARLRMLVTEPQAGDFTGLTVVSQVPAAGTRVGLGASVGVALRAAQVAGVPPPEVDPAPAPINPPRAPAQPPIATLQPTAMPAKPVVPAPAPATPATPVTPAAPATPVPETTIAQVRQVPTLPIGQAAPPVTPVTPSTPPPSSSIWLWPLLLLLLLGVIPARNYIWKPLVKRMQPPKAAVMPPLVPRITLIPRLDTGRQVVTTQHRGPAGGIDVVYHVTAGTQHVRTDIETARVADTGA